VSARLQLNLPRSCRVRTSGPCIKNDDDDDATHINLSLCLWNQSRDPHGTIVERYLASRKLTLPDHIVDEVVRFHPSLTFERNKVGAMVALFRDITTNNPCGIHRTFLDGHARKLGRKMLGRVRNGAIKLDDDASVTLGLTVGEGLETCIAAWLAGFRPVWTLGSVSRIASFPVLPGIEAITILGEVEDGGANRRATEQCTARWHGARREVLVVTPLVGKDLNDAWAA
jgi:hypothetical protein